MEKRVIASCGLCNVASLNIYDIEYGIDDYVVVGLNSQKCRSYKLYTNTKGTYFNWGGTRYYLDDFMRI